MNNLMNTDNVQMMSSKDIAELTGKRIGDVHRDIKKMLDTLDDNELCQIDEVRDAHRPSYTKYFLLPQAIADKLLARYEKVGIARKGKETAALSTIEQVLNIKLIRNFHVSGFFIDGYDQENQVAYEIDEGHHRWQKVEDQKRQSFIEGVLNCTFVRIVL